MSFAVPIALPALLLVPSVVVHPAKARVASKMVEAKRFFMDKSSKVLIDMTAKIRISNYKQLGLAYNYCIFLKWLFETYKIRDLTVCKFAFNT